jgi:hypothetical protein
MSITMSDSDPPTTDALTTIISVLKPLTSEERQRTVGAAMLFLGETAALTPRRSSPEQLRDAVEEGIAEGGYSPHITKWTKLHDVSAEELDHVFHFHDDGTFDLLHAPGKSKKEQTLNTYTLTGLGRYLTTNQRAFDDARARAFCETIGCYDSPHHAEYLKSRGGEFSGDKTKGYSLTNVGIKNGAALVKQAAKLST